MSGRADAAPLRGIRILELTQRYPPALGGVERYVERLAEELARAGATVEVVTSDLDRDEPFTRGRFPAPSGPVSVRRHRAYLAASAPHGTGIVIPGMLREALRSDVDVVHAHAFGHFPLWVGQLARALRGPRLVVTPHSDPGSGTPLAGPWSRFVARTAIRGADRTVALSRLEASWLTGLGVRPERIRVIPAGIDLAEFASLPPRKPHSEGPVVLFVGRLDLAQKGLGSLVRAMALLPRDLEARLRVVGADWGGRGPTISLARSLGISDRVETTGAVSRSALLAEYASADLFVLPSLFDSFPVVVIEAMAAALPVVATRVGGVPEEVEDGRSGLLVPPGDPPALAEAIRIVLSDPALRARFAAEGSRRAPRFSWPAIVPEYVRLFSEICDRRTVPAREL
jgi:glycosyltransferase involved in cell wall biosynthesis